MSPRRTTNVAAGLAVYAAAISCPPRIALEGVEQGVQIPSDRRNPLGRGSDIVENARGGAAKALGDLEGRDLPLLAPHDGAEQRQGVDIVLQRQQAGIKFVIHRLVSRLKRWTLARVRGGRQ